ncbi:MAG: hypothetical protein ACRETI_08710 [Steroidobacteraceae bacterium]
MALRRSPHLAAILAATGLASCAAFNVAMRGPGYEYYVTGNPADVVRPTRGLWVLQGGGDDVDENYIRMGAAGGGGDFMVLRASGEDQYNDYIFDLCQCDSVETFVFDDRAATADPFVFETIRNAEALWIAGGDQSRYVRYWKDSPVEDAIHFVAAKPAPVGGTSAGMAPAFIIAQQCRWADFDGSLLLARDREQAFSFTGSMMQPCGPEVWG